MKILIAKDGFPFEYVNGRPVMNFIRKILYWSHYEDKEVYEKRTGIKVNTSNL